MADLGDFQIGVVRAMVAQGKVECHAHPSKQACGYQAHMKNMMSLFDRRDVSLNGFAYCYNYKADSECKDLFDPQYQPYTKECPLFAGDQETDFVNKLLPMLSGGNGDDVYNEFFGSEIRQTSLLMDAASAILNGDNRELTLVDGQIEAEAKILEKVLEAQKDPNKKHAIIVTGGPGTGKTLIALRVLGDLIRALGQNGKKPSVYYTTRSYALRDTLKERLGAANDVIGEIYSFNPTDHKENDVDVLLVDEAHRIAASGNSYYYQSPTGSKGMMTYLDQTMSLLYCAKVCVFFLDEKQIVNNTEKGSPEEIGKTAKAYWKNLRDQYVAFQKTLDDAEKEYVDLEKAQNKLKELYDERDFRRAMFPGSEADFEKEYPDLFGKIRKLEKKLYPRKKKAGDDETEEDETGADPSPTKQNAYEKAKEHWKACKRVNVLLTSCCDCDVETEEIELTSEFRCNGSDNFLDWVDHILYDDTATVIDNNYRLGGDYEFEVCESPQELEEKIRERDIPYLKPGETPCWGGRYTNDPNQKQKARLVAGWCWEWSKTRDKQTDGFDLKRDVVIGNWSMPWETHKGGPKATGVYEPLYAPSANTWASDYRGINQVGCTPSAQGFEFDYVGVILGPDIRYDEENGCVIVPDNGEKLTYGKVNGILHDTYIRNIYRVLMTRGKKGCCVYCCDKALNEYLKYLKKMSQKN